MLPTHAELFPDLPEGAPGRTPPSRELGAQRVLLPNRGQMEFRASELDSLLPESHRARLVWSYVERQPMEAFYAPIKVREGTKGRSAIAPEILLALWLYATLEGIGAAREISRLTEAHDAYRWLCGGVGVNYHSLSDFRVEHGEALNELLSVNVASLMAAGVVKLKRVAQDGMRVRASAGTGSFRRQEKLERYLDQARCHVARLKEEIDADPGVEARRSQAAKARAAREREARLQKALDRLPELEAIKARQGKKPETARASMTDAEATVMKMADGGFRPAYNPQLATDAESLVIVGVDVVTAGSDAAQMAPMVEQVETRYGQAPESWLVDGGYTSHEQIERVAEKTVVYGPVPKPKDDTVDAHQPKPGDSGAVAAWRERMGTDEAKAIYKQRAATAECANAQARNRGLQRLTVRGVKKVKCVVLLFVLAHNLVRMATLAPDLLGIGTGTSAVARIGA